MVDSLNSLPRVSVKSFFTFDKPGHLSFDDRYDNPAFPFKFETFVFKEMLMLIDY